MMLRHTHMASLLRVALGIGLVYMVSTFFGCKEPLPKKPKPLLDEITGYTPYLRQRSYWPTKDWQSAKPKDVGMDSDLLERAATYAFTRTGDDLNRKGIRTDSLVVIKNGKIVLERYARGYKRDTSHLTWSVSKSFVNALFGVAVKQGLIDIKQPAFRYEPLLARGEHKKITVRDLLQMSSGLFWSEGYEASPLKSSVIMMLYTAGRGDMGKFAAQQPMEYPAGSHWYYSSGTSNLLMRILRNVLKEKYERFVWDFFKSIGMDKVTWERDGSGNYVGSSFLHTTPRNLAKFAYLYLNDGFWGGQRVLPEKWVRFTTTTSKASQDGYYGAHWWLNVGRPKQNVGRRWPAAPADCFYAGGHWGQYAFVIPSLDLVVVRMGDDRDKSFDRNQLLGLVIQSIKKKAKPAAPAKEVQMVKEPTKAKKATKVMKAVDTKVPPKKEETKMPSKAPSPRKDVVKPVPTKKSTAPAKR